MMNRRIEIKKEGMFTIQEIGVGDKPIVQQVARGWHVLFLGEDGNKRFGYVLKIDLEKCQLTVLDDIAFPNAPSPIGVQQGEIVPFDVVIIAGHGFSWLRDEMIYEAGKKIGKRQIAIMIKGHERDADVGWLDRRTGPVYVDRQQGRWCVR